MRRFSAGILVYRFKNNECEVLLVHPGGPFFAKKDDGIWSIPKGVFEDDEQPLDAAKREFEEETGYSIKRDEWIELTPIKQSSNKIVYAWATKGDFDADNIHSNTFFMEWPPHSGQQGEFPEVDRAGWFSLEQAKEKLYPGQHGFIDELAEKLDL